MADKYAIVMEYFEGSTLSNLLQTVKVTVALQIKGKTHKFDRIIIS